MDSVERLERITMILDIVFLNKPPVQYQNVRMTSVYPRYSMDAAPEIVIHFYDNLYPQVNIKLSEVECISTTND